MAVRIGEAARRSGLTIDTIRYYDSLGLFDDQSRDAAGRRVFDDDDVAWLVFLRRMRETGMPLPQLRDYITYRGRGADGVPGVLDVLRDHREAMRRQQRALEECVGLIESKILKYEALAAVGGSPGAPEV